MTARRSTAIAGMTLAVVAAVALATSSRAKTADPLRHSATRTATTMPRVAARERPRGAVEDCSTAPGWGRRDEFTRRHNLIVGPFALERARPMLGYAPDVRGNKIFVHVKGGRRVTLELSPAMRHDVGFAFAPGSGFRNWRRVVTFIACRRGQLSDSRFDGWPVTSWVGFLLASSPRCVPLLVWVDDEPSPRRAVIRFGVRDCGVRAPEQPTLCSAGEVEALVGRFVGAFNKGDAGELDDIFAHEPEFEWYSTDAPGERLTPLANDRSSLVGYFRERHVLSEQLKLGSFTFNGNATGSRLYGNFVYTLTRSADDLAATPYRGKGAALCYRNRSDVIFVWSMARE
jgi:hypothetical protein